jgi:hypothetical protein
VVGIGAALLWARRRDPVARSLLAATLAVTVVWSYLLLGRTPTWNPALRTVVLAAGLGLAVALAGAMPLEGRAGRAVAVGALAVALAGPGAYSLTTAATARSGAIPTAGPGRSFVLGGGGPAVRRGGRQGGLGGLLSGSRPSDQLTAVLKQCADRYTWVAAAVGSNSAAGYQLATRDPVMAIGGFNGTDPAPTLEQFQSYVARGEIHWFVSGGGAGFGGAGPGAAGTTGTTTASAITSWVTPHFVSTTVGGATLYDLTRPVAA